MVGWENVPIEIAYTTQSAVTSGGRAVARSPFGKSAAYFLIFILFLFFLGFAFSTLSLITIAIALTLFLIALKSKIGWLHKIIVSIIGVFFLYLGLM